MAVYFRNFGMFHEILSIITCFHTLNFLFVCLLFRLSNRKFE